MQEAFGKEDSQITLKFGNADKGVYAHTFTYLGPKPVSAREMQTNISK